MINFEEELKKFHPSLEVEDAEEAIYNHYSDSFKRTGSVEKTENRRQNCNGRLWRWTDLGCIYRRMDLKK